VGVGLAPAHLFHERAAARATPTKPLLNSLYSTALQLTCRTRSSTVFAMEARSHNPWKARLTIGLIMLGMALISLIILQMHAAIYWFFCWAMAIIDAILCIGWVMSSRNRHHYRAGILQQIFHWLGLIAVMYLLALLIDRGTVTQTEAGLFALTLLAFTLYLAGLYTDVIFTVIGITMGLMAAGMILVPSYLLLVMVPVFVIVGFFIVGTTNRQRKGDKKK